MCDGDHVHGHHDHDHDHDHHDHGQEHPLESYDHVQGGSPIIDIGGDIGAMVAYLDDDSVGTELFLRTADDPPRSVHTGVWPRRHGCEHVAAAVFAELTQGTYWLVDPAGGDERELHVAGGELTEIDLRSA